MRRARQSGRWWQREFGPAARRARLEPADDAGAARVPRTRRCASSRARWKVVALHHPPYSAGYQGSDLPTRERSCRSSSGTGSTSCSRRTTTTTSGVVPIDGVTYIVTGGAARARFSGTAPFTAASFRVRHFVDIAASPDSSSIRAIDQDGLVFDEVGPGGIARRSRCPLLACCPVIKYLGSKRRLVPVLGDICAAVGAAARARPVHRDDTRRAGVQAARCACHGRRHGALRARVRALLRRARRAARIDGARSRPHFADLARPARHRRVRHRDVLPPIALLPAAQRTPHRRHP